MGLGPYLFVAKLLNLQEIKGRHESRSRTLRLDRLWVGGIVVGASFILAVIIAFLIINAFSGWKFPFTIGLFLGTAICYLVAVIGLNLWAKTFQRKRGIKLDPIVGWKWYVKKYKEIFANEKSRQKKSQQTPKL